MDSLVNKRVREIASYLKMSTNEFSKSIGVPQTTLSNVFNRNSEIRSNILFAILVKYRFISAEWLLLGEGNMIKDSPTTNLNEESSRLIMEYTAQTEKLIEQRDKEIRSLQLQIAMLKSKQIANVDRHEKKHNKKENHE